MDRNYWREHPYVTVGITESPESSFTLNGPYSVSATAEGSDRPKPVSGQQTATISDGMVVWNGIKVNELTFTPEDNRDNSFTLKDVVIGIDFHWQRKEQQTFQGSLRLLAHENKIIAINCVHIEDYLLSVISSEMSATSSLEFLKAAAIISRSWLLKQIENRLDGHEGTHDDERIDTDNEYMGWNDREDHVLFDVCADDHCQRYQGIQKAVGPTVAQAIKETWGMVLTSDDNICDARFYKCCGGITEEYNVCWENIRYKYLTAVCDCLPEERNFPDLTVESEAEKWIRSNPPAFCNTQDKAILGQVLNDYDLETMDFYRWKQEYSQEDIRRLIERGTGKDLGNILDLVPLERGLSGRIYKLRIIGSKRTYTVGKELVIRRILSTSHLYSSAFVIDKEDVCDGIPQKFILHGAGWGHGVGLCQIGAAVMGAKGYPYDKILLHYYQNANIEKIY